MAKKKKSSATTGQIFVRATNAKAPDGRRMVMVAGVLAVPDDFPLKPEHQYTVCDMCTALDNLILTPVQLVVGGEGKDLTEEMKGHTINGVLTSPVWRV